MPKPVRREVPHSNEPQPEQTYDFDLANIMREVMPEIWGEFEAQYWPPRYEGNKTETFCTRCHCPVDFFETYGHDRWHKNISAAIFLLQGWALAHMRAHETAPTLGADTVQPAQPDTNLPHRCHAAGCDREVPAAMLMCKPHWAMVPRPLQKAVWKFYVRGQEETKTPSGQYRAAAKAAVKAVQDAEASR